MRIGALILAAGASQRFGRVNKLLADLCGRPLLVHTLDAVRASRIAPRDTVVVTGAEHDALAALAHGAGFEARHCAEHASGMGRSIACGVAAVPGGLDGLLVLPGDMPAMTGAIIDRVLDAFEDAGGDRIVYAADADGHQRHPVVWPRRLFASLAALEGPQGAKGLIGAEPVGPVVVTILDDLALSDVDTAEDLARLEKTLKAGGRLG